MLKQYYDEVVSSLMPTILDYRDIIIKIAETSQLDFDILIKVQDEIIKLGTVLEADYHLENTPVLKSLEQIAELIYKKSIGQEDVSDELKKVAMGLYSDFRSSISISEGKLALVLIIKDEAEYVKEWLEFHLMLGVDHFYIYDNESTDCLKDVLQTYIEKGIVTYHYWPGRFQQTNVYDHALHRYKYDTVYMGFIDTDEFLIPVIDEDIPTAIDRIFNSFEEKDIRNKDAGGIGINWRIYGTSFHKEKPKGMVIENYKYRAKDDYLHNCHIKVICKPILVKRFQWHPHNVEYIDDSIVTISEKGSEITGPYFYDSGDEILRLNHYYTRSEKEFYYKTKVRGWADGSPDQIDKDYLEKVLSRIDDGNDIFDPVCDKYIEVLKKRIDS